MYKRPSNKMFNLAIICGIFVALLILLHIFVGEPILKYANKLKSEFKSKQAKLQDSEALIRSLPNPQKAMEDIEKKTAELKDRGVTPRQIPRLIQLLADPASKLKLNVISIKPRDDIKSSDENLPAGVNKVYIEIIISGSYELIGEYIKILSELPVGFNIEQLSMQAKEEAASLEARKSPEKPEVRPPDILATLLVSIYTIWEI